MISHTRAYHVHSLSFETLIDRNSSSKQRFDHWWVQLCATCANRMEPRCCWHWVEEFGWWAENSDSGESSSQHGTPMGTIRLPRRSRKFILVLNRQGADRSVAVSSTVAPVPALPKVTWKLLMFGYFGIISIGSYGFGREKVHANTSLSSNRLYIPKIMGFNTKIV